MPVAVAGMHRSGTSLVIRILAECGLDLGDPADLDIRPTAHNLGGHWENSRFVAINRRLLAAQGGSWDRPPALAGDWLDQPALAPIRREAKELVASFDSSPAWGWKDPRTSLVLPFWLELVPDLQVVICLRHPLEVAASLRRRDYLPASAAQRLWSAYYQRLAQTTAPDRRLITWFDRFFGEPQDEIVRMLGFLGLEVPAERLARASSLIAPDQRHHHLAENDSRPLSPETGQLYRMLAGEAGTAATAHGSPPGPPPVFGGDASDDNSPLEPAGETAYWRLRSWLTPAGSFRRTLFDLLTGAGLALAGRGTSSFNAARLELQAKWKTSTERSTSINDQDAS